MASSAIGREVAMRLLFSSSSSSLFARASSLALGLGFPVYLSFKALEKKSQKEQEQWLAYWAVYGCFNLVEKISDKLISWFPFYHHAKLVFLMWLQLPSNYGVRYIYFKYMRPFLLKHQSRLDRITDARTEMDNFVNSHQKDIEAAGNVVQNFLISAYRSAERTVRSSLYSDTPCE